MKPDLAERMIQDFEQGRISRRQLATRLVGLGTALAATEGITRAGQAQGMASTFQATGLDHVALTVKDVQRSQDFYKRILGLEVIRQEEGRMCFMGRSDGFFLALFQGSEPGLNHYCYRIENDDPDQVVEKLREAGISPRRESNRVYFDDPDGIEVQVSGS